MYLALIGFALVFTVWCWLAGYMLIKLHTHGFI